MNFALKFGVASMLLVSGSTFSANVVPGWYGGIFLGGTFRPNQPINLFTPFLPGVLLPGRIYYEILGNIGGEIGWRMDHFRAEAEIDYVGNPYQKLEIAGTRVPSRKRSRRLHFNGSSSIGAIFLNGYYDFFPLESDCDFGPYAGLGIGYAYIQNHLKFYNNNIYLTGTNYRQTKSVPIGQIILGTNYFLDDFTAFSLDYRYASSKNVNDFGGSRVQYHSLNFGFSGSFDCF